MSQPCNRRRASVLIFAPLAAMASWMATTAPAQAKHQPPPPTTTTVAAPTTTTAAPPTPPLAGSSCANGYVSLSFDDGPTPSTPSLLAALRKAGITATFFDMGIHAQQYPSAVVAEKAAGHAVGNHTYDHPDLVQVGEPGARNEISETQAILTPLLGGAAPTLFRPPYGSTSNQVLADATALGLTQVIWTTDTQDWSGVSTSSIVSAALSVQSGGFVLMHDGYPNTIAAIPGIAAGLAARGLCPGKIVYSAVPTLSWMGGWYFNATVAPLTSTAPIGPPPAGSQPTGMSALLDNFDAPTFNTSLWNGSSIGTVGQTDGRGYIPCTTSYPTIGTTTTYDLTDAGAFARFTLPPSGNGSREAFLSLMSDASDQLQWTWSGGALAPRDERAGVWAEGAPLTYDATADAWLRIRESAGSVVWETSADGHAWTTAWSVPDPFPVTAMTASMICGYWGTESAADAFVDNFNLAP